MEARRILRKTERTHIIRPPEGVYDVVSAHSQGGRVLELGKCDSFTNDYTVPTFVKLLEPLRHVV